MKIVLVTSALALCACVSTAAMAQTAATGTVDITATVTASCSIDTVTAAGLLDTFDFSNAGASLISTTAQTNSTLATGDCNTATHIKLTSLNGAAKLGGAGAPATSGGYSNFFDYTALVAFGGVSVTLDTSSTAGFATSTETITSAAATAGPANGDIAITVTPVGTPKLQVGTHSDTLTIELTANQLIANFVRLGCLALRLH